MTFPQYLAWKEAVAKASALVQDDQVPWDDYDAALAPGIMACVEKWELAGLPEKVTTFPATPRLPSHRLLIWLMRAITEVIQEDEDIPKE